MTTEAGLPRAAACRKHIERLRDRLDYLDGWLAAFRSARGYEENGFRRAEAEAIRWAIPVLEAEWADVARLHDEHVGPAEATLDSIERRERAIEQRERAIEERQQAAS